MLGLGTRFAGTASQVSPELSGKRKTRMQPLGHEGLTMWDDRFLGVVANVSTRSDMWRAAG